MQEKCKFLKQLFLKVRIEFLSKIPFFYSSFFLVLFLVFCLFVCLFFFLSFIFFFVFVLFFIYLFFLFLFFLASKIYWKNIVSVSLFIPLTKINHLTLKLILEGSFLCIWKRCCTLILLKDIIMQQFKTKWTLSLHILLF